MWNHNAHIEVVKLHVHIHYKRYRGICSSGYHVDTSCNNVCRLVVKFRVRIHCKQCRGIVPFGYRVNTYCNNVCRIVVKFRAHNHCKQYRDINQTDYHEDISYTDDVIDVDLGIFSDSLQFLRNPPLLTRKHSCIQHVSSAHALLTGQLLAHLRPGNHVSWISDSS